MEAFKSLTPPKSGSQFRFPLDLPSQRPALIGSTPGFSRDQSVEPSMTEATESVDDPAAEEYQSARNQLRLDHQFRDLARLQGQLSNLPKIETKFDDDSDAGDLRNLPDSPSSTSISMYSSNTPAVQTPLHAGMVGPTMNRDRAKSTSQNSNHPGSNNLAAQQAHNQPPSLFLFNIPSHSSPITVSHDSTAPNATNSSHVFHPIAPSSTSPTFHPIASGAGSPVSIMSGASKRHPSTGMEEDVPEDPIAEAAAVQEDRSLLEMPTSAAESAALPTVPVETNSNPQDIAAVALPVLEHQESTALSSIAEIDASMPPLSNADLSGTESNTGAPVALMAEVVVVPDAPVEPLPTSDAAAIKTPSQPPPNPVQASPQPAKVKSCCTIL